jgi:hypothetical protein
VGPNATGELNHELLGLTKVKGVQVKRCHVEVGSGSERNWRTKPRITGSHNIPGCARGSPERRTGTGPRDGTIQGGSRGSPERRTGTGPWDGNGYSWGSPERRTGVVQSKSLRRSRESVKVDSVVPSGWRNTWIR